MFAFCNFPQTFPPAFTEIASSSTEISTITTFRIGKNYDVRARIHQTILRLQIRNGGISLADSKESANEIPPFWFLSLKIDWWIQTLVSSLGFVVNAMSFPPATVPRRIFPNELPIYAVCSGSETFLAFFRFKQASSHVCSRTVGCRVVWNRLFAKIYDCLIF